MLSQYFHRHHITVTTLFSNIYFHIYTTSFRSINLYKQSYNELIHTSAPTWKHRTSSQSIFFSSQHKTLYSSSNLHLPHNNTHRSNALQNFATTHIRHQIHQYLLTLNQHRSTNQTIRKYQYRLNRTQAATSSTTHHHYKHCYAFDRDSKQNKMNHIDPNQTSTLNQLDISMQKRTKLFIHNICKRNNFLSHSPTLCNQFLSTKLIKFSQNNQCSTRSLANIDHTKLQSNSVFSSLQANSSQ